VRRSGGSKGEHDERNSDDSSSHKAPRGLGKAATTLHIVPNFPLFGVRKVTQTRVRMRFGASE